MANPRRPFTILCISGVGHPEIEDQWFEVWKRGILRILNEDCYNELDLNLVPYHFREVFRDTPIDECGYAEGLAELDFGTGQGGAGKLFRTSSGMDPLAEALKWRAATVVLWAQDAGLRSRLAADLKDCMIAHQPDLILAHSLGSLIAYDSLLQLSTPFLKERSLVTFGSQLGNPYVRNHFAGRIVSPPVKQWFHLYNENDRVFTAPLQMRQSNYALVNVTFDNADPLDHTAISTGSGSIGYLDHFTTRQLVWPNVLRPTIRSPFLRSVRRARRQSRGCETPDHRALLIGVDQYEHSSVPDLDGCVTDTYLMSESLQAAGFPADNIRLLHNSRATKDAIMDRIEWLLDDIEEGGVPEFRLLHFSGHGAQIASYGVGETVDRLDECLCPHDFDWSVERSILDDLFCSHYAQLPYDAHFVVVLDCCHSGGMARGGQSVRGLSGPRDVAHRALTYEPGDSQEPHGIWRPKYAPFLVNEELFPEGEADADQRALWLGRQGTLRKLGRSASLRQLDAADYDKRRADYGHLGPYLPTIFQACQEDEPALEHVQGSTIYGAFTFSLSQSLASLLQQRQELAYRELLSQSRRILRKLGYSQEPQLLMPSSKVRLAVPNFRSSS